MNLLKKLTFGIAGAAAAKKSGNDKPSQPSGQTAEQTQAQARIDQARRAGMMGLGQYPQFQRQPINYQPQPFLGLGQQPGQMPMIRQPTMDAVLGPFGQPNWGQPQFGQDPRNQLMNPILNRAWK